MTVSGRYARAFASASPKFRYLSRENVISDYDDKSSELTSVFRLASSLFIGKSWIGIIRNHSIGIARKGTVSSVESKPYETVQENVQNVRNVCLCLWLSEWDESR